MKICKRCGDSPAVFDNKKKNICIVCGNTIFIDKKEDNIYIMICGYGNYGKEVEISAKDIFEATKKGIDIFKKRMIKAKFVEQDGSDISLRIWRIWE
jgi:ribosomal protein S27AE